MPHSSKIATSGAAEFCGGSGEITIRKVSLPVHQKRKAGFGLFAKVSDRTLVSCQPYLMNRRNDDLRMFGWHFVAAVDDDLLAMGRETSQLRL